MKTTRSLSLRPSVGRRVLPKSNPRAREAHGQSAMANTEEEVMVSASEVRKTFLEVMT